MKHPKNLATRWSNYFVEEIEFGSDLSFAAKASRVPKVIYSLEARRKLAALLLESRPDVCHAHNIYHHISPSILGLLHSRGVPTVLTVHDLKLACPAYTMLARDGICERCKNGRLYNVVAYRCIKQSAVLSGIVMLEAIVHRTLRTYARHVNRFVVPSRFHISKLREWGMPGSLFSHVPNSVNADHYRPQFAPGQGLVYFGRLSDEKGVATLIRASALAHCRLRVVGTGAALPTLQRLANEVGADVTFLGYLTGERLHAAVRSARAVALPSECYENAPMSILEAYALGKPVIGARIGGIPELIREHETGLGFASGDVEALADTIRGVMNMPDPEVEAMGRTGRAWVESEFSRHLYRERILDIYREIGVKV
jgi:glycosyltransferase involved in cell wall biosynthesis